MNKFILLLLLFNIPQRDGTTLENIQWIHGSLDCSKNKDALIQVVQYNANTWILRQNKCINYEAPFMFLFIGNEMALLMDTGATTEAAPFPLYSTVAQIIDSWEKENNKKVTLLVAHTHSHGDHWAGDGQFKDKTDTTVIGLTIDDVIKFFGFKDWPNDKVQLDLGDRKIKIIPIPGHDKTSIALYDEQTQLLLTGDTFYPGRLYVRDWPAFKNSIQRLTDFTFEHKISYLVGNHIEMSTKATIDYPTGSTWQPQEHALPLTVGELQLLNNSLGKMDRPALKAFDSFIIVPK